MINKNELRLGSLVLMKETTSYDEWELVVYKLSEDELELASPHAIYTGVTWNLIEPVSIFYWHLETAGFTRSEAEMYSLHDWEFNLKTRSAIWRKEVSFNVRYVHQLQNLLLANSGINLDFSQANL